MTSMQGMEPAHRTDKFNNLLMNDRNENFINNVSPGGGEREGELGRKLLTHLQQVKV